MFNFKQFSIKDDLSSMKVGTDAIIVGCLAHHNECHSILDIGTGCGIVALILAQRYPYAHIDAIDIDMKSIEQASYNFEVSPWNERLKVRCISAQELRDEHYDLIVSNPPFFVNSLKAPSQQRNLARHTDTLSYNELFKSASTNLSSQGRFVCILPYSSKDLIMQIATREHLWCENQTIIRNTPMARPKRIVFSFINEEIDTTTLKELIIRNNDNSYSESYRKLTADFYTHLR